MKMGNSLSPIVSNIYMVHCEKLALDTAQYTPSLWLQYVDDMFAIWPHGLDRLQDFLNHLGSLRTSIQFTMETESDGMIPFLDVLFIRRGLALTTKVYNNKKTVPTLAATFTSIPIIHRIRRGLVQSLHCRACILLLPGTRRHTQCNWQHGRDLQLSGYPKQIKSRTCSSREKEGKPRDQCLSHMRRASHKSLNV
jgi:hypothetical protein